MGFFVIFVSGATGVCAGNDIQSGILRRRNHPQKDYRKRLNTGRYADILLIKNKYELMEDYPSG